MTSSDCTAAGAAALLAEAPHITLICHVRPDGDALGSALGLAHPLRATGKNVLCLNQDGVPGMYDFLPGREWVQVPPYDIPADSLIVSLDTSTPERLGKAFAATGRKVDVAIDHHVSNTRYAIRSLVDPAKASTAEIVLHVIRAAGWPLDPAAAANLYVGISTDTGSFRYRGTTPKTLRDAAELIEAGADAPELARLCYQSLSRPRFDLQRKALAGLEMELDGRLSHLTIGTELFTETGALPEDTEGLVEQALSVNTVELAAFFEIRANQSLKVSLRSKGKYNVSEIATSFGGGGHPGAAGINFPGDAEHHRVDILAELRRRMAA